MIRLLLIIAMGVMAQNPKPGGASGGGGGSSGVSSVSAGTQVTTSGTADVTVNVDTATTPNYATGAGAPSANCSAGAAIYLDTTNTRFYRCSATNTWMEVARTSSGSGAPGAGACDAAVEVGSTYYRTDNTSAAAAHYGCAQTGSGTYGWVIQGGGGGTTNVHTIWLPSTIKDNGTIRYIWDFSTAASQLVGVAPNRYSGFSFPDAAVTTAGMNFPLPTSWAGGAVGVRIFWSTSSSVSTSWRAAVRIACVADGEDVTSPSFNADSLATLPYGGVGNRLTIDTISNVAVTNCAAGEFALMNLERIGTDGADDMVQTISVPGVEVSYTRNN